MKKSSFLRVISVTEAQDKNKKSYNNIVVATPGVITIMTDEGEKSVKVKSRQSSFNAWQESYLESMNSQPDFGYDVKEGDLLAGTIVTRKVKTAIRNSEKEITGYADTYVIENEGRADTITNEYSTVVLGDTSDEEGFDAEIRKTFRRADHPLVDDPAVTGIALLAAPKPDAVLEAQSA